MKFGMIRLLPLFRINNFCSNVSLKQTFDIPNKSVEIGHLRKSLEIRYSQKMMKKITIFRLPLIVLVLINCCQYDRPFFTIYDIIIYYVAKKCVQSAGIFGTHKFC